MKISTIENKMSKAAVNKIVADEKLSKSAKMKELFTAGLTVKEIAELLGVRYNFVYNVVSNHCMINDITVEKKATGSKKADIIRLFSEENKSTKEIAVELKINYNYVYKVLRDYKNTMPAVQEAAVTEVK